MMGVDANYLDAGKLVLFSDGEYSDYNFGSCFVATKTVTLQEARVIADKINKAKAEAEEKVGWYDGDAKTEFVLELVKAGVMIEVDVTERHIGSYGSLEIY